MNLQDSPLSSSTLRQTPERFLTLLGVTVEQFDALFEQLYQRMLDDYRRRHRLWREERLRTLLERYRQTYREHLCITILYLRQYMIQETLAATYALHQASVSKIVARISQLLETILPIPERAAQCVYERIQQMTPEHRQAVAATLIIDASEQRIERSSDHKQQKHDYSGKKKCHTRKTQFVQTLTGIILDLSQPVGGSVHDFTLFKEHALAPWVERLLDLMQRVRVWIDSGYQGIAKQRPDWQCYLIERARRGHPLTTLQKITNKMKSRIRIAVEHTISRVKKYRCCSDRTRNTSAPTQALRWRIVAGLCNLRLAVRLGIADVFGYAQLVQPLNSA